MDDACGIKGAWHPDGCIALDETLPGIFNNIYLNTISKTNMPTLYLYQYPYPTTQVMTT
jgi:hypothetical protein